MARTVRNGLIKLFFGKTKSGKSYLAEQMLKSKSKSIVYDYAQCFSKGTIIYDLSITNLSKLIKKYGGKNNLKKSYKLIFRRPNGMTHHDAVDLLALFATKLGQSYGRKAFNEGEELVFLVDEADKCSSRKDSDRLRILAGAGRHDNIATWAICQVPMNLHPDLRRNASEIFAFKLATPDAFYKQIFTKSVLERLSNAPKYSHMFWNDEGVLEAVNAKGKVKAVS